MSPATLPSPEHTPDDALAGMVESGPAWAARAAQSDPTIIPGVMSAGGLCVVAAEPKAGKTWWLLGVALAVANGLPLLGHQPVERAGRVLLVLTEGSHAGTVARLKSLAIGYGLDPLAALADIDVIWRRGIDLTDAKVVGALCSRDYPLVIVDVARDVWPGDENSAADVGELLRGVRPVLDAGSTVAFALHMGKPGEGTRGRRPGMRIRGSSAFYAAADSMVYMEPGKNRVVKVSFESRDDAPAETMLMTMPAGRVDGTEGVRLDYRPLGEGVGTAAKVESVVAAVTGNPGLSGNAVASLVVGQKAAVLTALKVAEQAGRLANNGHGWFPTTGTGAGGSDARFPVLGNHAGTSGNQLVGSTGSRPPLRGRAEPGTSAGTDTPWLEPDASDDEPGLDEF